MSDQGVKAREWHAFYFRAFDALRYDRFYGAFGGQMPISYLSLSAYARDHGITGAALSDFLRTMHKLDNVFLEVEAQRAKDARQNGVEQ